MIARLHELASTLREGLWVLVALALIGGGLWAFAELADEVADGTFRGES